MLTRTKRCKLIHKVLDTFLYVFNLRQGTILIAVHQLALSSFLLIILLVGISHASEMMSMLHNDMEDDAERRGLYEIVYGDRVSFHEGGVVSTNNQRRFANAQHLASVTVILLYTSTVMTSVYLVCCISLLYGAVKYKREYVVPWILSACVLVVMLFAAIVVGDGYPCFVSLFGGHNIYYFGCAIFVLTFIYAICTVSSFAVEICNGGSVCTLGDERGERLLLLDHAAQSSLLSAAQLSKLSQGSQTHFV